MQTKTYEQLQETLYFEKLDNGLSLYVLPKKGFRKTFATFSTKYGSIDNDFQVQGKERTQVPDGIAHFLEHKMFEEPEGDIFARFASQGASANAYTSFDKTVYLFSSTGEVPKNLETLIDFVQNPYFTDDNVEKEKGIIGQEINMYRDNPDWRVYYGLIEALYQRHPVHIDIAGTIPSITQITKEMLYTCYHSFYHPSNMSLFVVGGVDPDEISTLVKQNQSRKKFEPQGHIERFLPDEPQEVREKVRRNTLPVSLPKFYMGFKETDLQEQGPDLQRKDVEMRIVMDILFSSTSDLYQKLYDEGLITDQFGSDYRSHPRYAFSVIGGDTKDPQKLEETIQQELSNVLKQGLSEHDFERTRKKKMGGYLRMLNSPEGIANQFTDYLFKGMDFFETLSLYESVTLDQINERMRKHFDWNRCAVSIVSSDKK
ncbi:EF-P 5-aminopentanol modification-associated protein YfmH [Marinicrinis lubricantis]|uniref:EF-P 5-aminopentanol modification-associated protein YfmH n=1 Tax=Marinicrinis lubricantis TaxID=2086470 RepID=A0ABW1IMC5_9BACL